MNLFSLHKRYIRFLSYIWFRYSMNVFMTGIRLSFSHAHKKRLSKILSFMQNSSTCPTWFAWFPFRDQEGNLGSFSSLFSQIKIYFTLHFRISVVKWWRLSPMTNFSNGSFPLFSHTLISINGTLCRALRISFVEKMGKYSFIYWLHF